MSTVSWRGGGTGRGVREEIQFCKKYRQLFYPAKIILSLKNVFILLILILFGSFLHYFEANFLKLGNRIRMMT